MNMNVGKTPSAEEERVKRVKAAEQLINGPECDYLESLSRWLIMSVINLNSLVDHMNKIIKIIWVFLVKNWKCLGMKSFQISHKVRAEWSSCAIFNVSYFLLRNGEQSFDCVVGSGLSQLLTMRSSYSEQPPCHEWDMCCIYCYTTIVFVFLSYGLIHTHLALSLSSPLPLTLTVRSISLNGQLNASILAKMAMQGIT